MHDTMIHVENTAEKKDMERAAQERDPACALPASRNSYEAEIKCYHSSYNPLDSTTARTGLWRGI